MAITFVGSVASGVQNGGSVTLNLATASPSAPSDGDLVIVFGAARGRAGNETRIGNALSYSEVFDQTNTTRLRVAYKAYVSGENSVVVESSGDANDGTTGIALIFRGVAASPLDVSIVSTTGSGLNPNLNSVTPASADCAIIAAVGSSVSDASVSGPTNYTDVHTNAADTNSTSLSAAYRILTGGAGSPEDPGNWTSWASGTWQGATIALKVRPAGVTLDAAAGSYDLSGTAATLKLARRIDAAAGSYALTGTAASPKIGRKAAAGAGAYALTGTDAALTIITTAKVVAGAGSYVLAGTAANLLHQRKVIADSGAYSLAGSAATLKTTRVLVTGAGAYLLTGSSVSLLESAALTLAPVAQYIFLAEISGHDGASVQDIFISTEAFTDSDTNRQYEPRIIDPGSFRRGLGLDGNPFAESSPIVVASADPGTGETLDDWLDLGFGMRPITIRAVPRGASRLSGQAVTIFHGTVERVQSSAPLNRLEIDITDRLGKLELPLLGEDSDRFAGTTLSTGNTAEGNADLQGQIKQRLFGVNTNVGVQPANPFDLIYLVNNAATASITLYDGGLALTNDGDSASITALRAATIAPGHYRTCLALGLVRVGATPGGELTADVVEGANAAARTAAQIAYRMLIAYGIDPSQIDDATFAALDVKNNAVVGAVIDDDRTALQAVTDVLKNIGARIVPDSNGKFQVFRVEAASAAPAELTFDLEMQDINKTLELVDINVPVYRVVLEYGRVYKVQQGDALFGAVTSERRAALGSEYRTVTSPVDTSESDAILLKHLNARELVVTTNIADPTDAQDEADRLFALLKQELKQWRVEFSLSDAFAADLGTSIGLVHERLGMASGVDAFVFDRNNLFMAQKIELTARV